MNKLRQSSHYFAAVAQAARAGDESAWESLSTFCLGTRSKEVQLSRPQAVFSEEQDTDSPTKVLSACRKFTYGNLPTTVAARALTHTLSEFQKKDPNSSGFHLGGWVPSRSRSNCAFETS